MRGICGGNGHSGNHKWPESVVSRFYARKKKFPIVVVDNIIIIGMKSQQQPAQ